MKKDELLKKFSDDKLTKFEKLLLDRLDVIGEALIDLRNVTNNGKDE